MANVTKNPIFRDEDAARAHLEKLRWLAGILCVHCRAYGDAISSEILRSSLLAPPIGGEGETTQSDETVLGKEERKRINYRRIGGARSNARNEGAPPFREGRAARVVSRTPLAAQSAIGGGL